LTAIGQPAPRPVPLPPEVLATPRDGLPPTPSSGRRVIVLGGGIAGLVAAHELVRAGHDPLVLEAQNRVGGRVYTLRDRFAPGLYAEAGAMRIPRVHDLTLGYCERFGLKLRPFVMSNPKGLVFCGGERMTAAQAAAEQDRLPFALADHERGRSLDDIWVAATQDLRDILAREGEAGWDTIRSQVDQYSLREFLELKGFSEGAIEMYGVMNFVESDMNNSVMEVLREDLGEAFLDMQEIAGGSDRLAYGFYDELEGRIRLGAEVRAVAQDESSVTVHYRTLAGEFSETGDHAVCALPFSVLRTVEALTPFSPAKQKAIRQLNYSDSTKILFQVRRRFWEAEDGILGGATVTDLPVRRLNYPSPDPETERGILLASYTWGQDASRWAAMDPESRIEQALDDVAQIHPSVRENFEVGASHSWYDDPFAGGAFALFSPGQQSLLQPDIVAPEGRIHFAGEHTSLHHAWIQGALESGIRAAREINELV
jgi:monoamine oxidase